MGGSYIAIVLLGPSTLSDSEMRNSLQAVVFGALGATLAAARYVVLAVRQSEFEGRRVPWQLMTPLFGAVLAFASQYLFRGGILFVADFRQPPDNLDTFVRATSFIVGMTSEFFTKRVIRAAEVLFGEQADPLIGDGAEPERAERRGKEQDQRDAESKVARKEGLRLQPCSVCDEVASGYIRFPDGQTSIRSLLMSEGDLALVPSVGALSIGHVLAITIDHETNLLPSLDVASRETAFELLVQRYRARTESQGKVVLLAEHGTKREPVAEFRCDTSHAHIHLVAVSDEVARGTLSRLNVELVSKSLKQLAREALPLEDYLYVGLFSSESPSTPEGGFVPSVLVTPQAFRRALAGALGVQDHDWKTSPNVENVRLTARLFS